MFLGKYYDKHGNVFDKSSMGFYLRITYLQRDNNVSNTDISVKTIHILGIVSFILTLILGASDISIIAFLKNSLIDGGLLLNIHYMALVIALILYLVIITKIGKLLAQNLLVKFGLSILFIVIGTFLLLLDFSLADGVSAISTPNIFVIILLVAICIIGIALIFWGAVKVCKLYWIIGSKTHLIYFKLSAWLIALSTILFFLFIATWLIGDFLPDKIKSIISIFGICYSISYILGQLMFSLGAYNLANEN